MMTGELKRTLRAFGLAPLVVPVLWCASAITLSSGVPLKQGPLHILGELFTVVFFSLPWIYGAALLVGLPAYVLIRRWWALRYWHCVAVGGAAGALILPLTNRLPLTAAEILRGAAFGLAAGALFWALWRPRPNRALNPPGLRPAG
jgi:hypothetical protein